MNPIIPKLKRLVRNTCKKPTNTAGYGAWTYHIKLVTKYSAKLANLLHADKEIVEIAAILHDYASVKNQKYDPEHEIIGAEFAQKILEKYQYPQDKIDLVKKCILNHRGSRLKSKSSIEEICVADADAMAHFYAISSLFFLCFYKHKLDIKDSQIWIWQKLNRSWQKLSPEAQKLIKPHYLAAKLLFGKS